MGDSNNLLPVWANLIAGKGFGEALQEFRGESFEWPILGVLR